MNLCPVCHAPLISANKGTEWYCGLCAAEGRQPLVSRMMGAAQMPPATAERPGKGTQKRHGALAGRGNNKFGAVPEVVDGIRFASGAEARRYRDLKLREAAGEIGGLELQPSFRLEVNGRLVCRYVADFAYTEGGVRVIEDVKSKPTKTSIYRLKKKLMAACHGIEIRETT